MASNYKVGEVLMMTVGYGFTIMDKNRAPIANFTYETREQADLARPLAEAVAAYAVDIRSYPAPKRR